jgi:hypothetical protein
VPPLRFELQIFRLPGKCGYSTRPPGTTSSLVLHPSHTARIGGRRGGSMGESVGRGGRGRLEGGKLEVEDVASGTEEAKAA